MIGYAMVGTNDPARALAFFDDVLGVLGARRMMEFSPESALYGVAMDQPLLGVGRPFDRNPATVGNGVMIALNCADREMVRAVHARALELGGADEGAPGIRGEPSMGFYAAYFRDLDGNKFAAFAWKPGGWE